MSLADWQRMTKDPEDTDAPVRCAARSRGQGRPHEPSECQECAETMGVCLRRMGHGGKWHEGRSRQGNLVSWSTLATPSAPEAAR
jgi:hypothetical protein